MRNNLLLLISFFLLFNLSTYASHNHAGHITYTEVGTNTYEITVVTYTDPSFAFVDRCDIDIEIWDGTGTTKITDLTAIPRANGPAIDPLFHSTVACSGSVGMGDYIIGSIKMNRYTANYTFSGPGTYLIRYSDIARSDNIVNISNSASQAFFVESMLTIGTGMDAQNSVLVLNNQLDFACAGQVYTYNPGAWDQDGDSISYEIIPCRQYDPPFISSPITCSGYQAPGAIGSNGQMVIDPASGLITWDVPQTVGAYSFAFKITEYRNGTEVGSTVVDQLVLVESCTNQPPVITTISDTTISPGTNLHFEFEVWDPDFPTDSLYFGMNTANLGFNSALLENPPASVNILPFSFLPLGTTDTIRGSVDWIPPVVPGRTAPYQIDFYAHDNVGYYAQSGTQRLSRHHVILIYVTNPVAVDETNTRHFDFKLSPNPAQNSFQVELNKFEPYQISVFDNAGRKVMEESGKGKMVHLDATALDSGLYLVQVVCESGRKVEKLLIQH